MAFSSSFSEVKFTLAGSLEGNSMVPYLVFWLECQERLCPTVSPSHRLLHQCFPFLPEIFPRQLLMGCKIIFFGIRVQELKKGTAYVSLPSSPSESQMATVQPLSSAGRCSSFFIFSQPLVTVHTLNHLNKECEPKHSMQLHQLFP